MRQLSHAPPCEAPRSLQKRWGQILWKPEAMDDWMKQSSYNGAVLKIWIHSSCDSIHKNCASSRRTKSKHRAEGWLWSTTQARTGNCWERESQFSWRAWPMVDEPLSRAGLMPKSIRAAHIRLYYLLLKGEQGVHKRDKKRGRGAGHGSLHTMKNKILNWGQAGPTRQEQGSQSGQGNNLGNIGLDYALDLAMAQRVGRSVLSMVEMNYIESGVGQRGHRRETSRILAQVDNRTHLKEKAVETGWCTHSAVHGAVGLETGCHMQTALSIASLPCWDALNMISFIPNTL